MAVIPISEFVAVRLRERGILPLTTPDRDIPDEWLALLEQMNGGGDPVPLPQTARRAPPGSA